MRIGIDATAMPRQPVGAGIYMINLVRTLAELKKDFDLIVFHHRSANEQLGPGNNHKFLSVEITDRSPAARIIWEQAFLPQLARRYKLDLLHSLHYTRPYFLPCASVVTFHDMTFFLYPMLHTRAKRLLFPLAMRASAKRANALIAVSENTRQDVIRMMGIPSEKIFTTQLGVIEDFRPITDTSNTQEISRKYKLPEKFILYVGLVEPRKNIPLLLRSFNELVAQGLTQDLVIVGRPGWSFEEVFDLVENLNLTPRVHFPGYISRQELPFVYNLAALFVYPTLYEGFGLPVLEAMACGIPTVTSRVASIPEIIGDAGIMVPPGDQPALTQAMREVLTNDRLRQELTHRGPQRAIKFTWKRTAEETLKVYRQVLKIS